MTAPAEDALQGVAIIGMAGRFPGADDVQAYWRNLLSGVESIRSFSTDELRAAGVPESLLSDPRYVPRGAPLRDIECFDAAFFGFAARDAQLLDPQHRLFLECSWEALEDAGYASTRRDHRVGVYGGAGFNQYLLNNVLPSLGEGSPASLYRVLLASDKDFLCTRVAHALDLRGPALTIQTGCSTSLVAVATAALHLLTHQCDLALAGGVSLHVPQTAGYLHEDGSIASPDGRCRAFDADAAGTVFGSGVGLVVLKRLPDAIADGDHVYAVISGFALNNDGAAKATYTAPSVDGQAAVIESALAMADAAAHTIGFIEAHGTGTALGDPIELTALARAFGAVARGTCAIGSVKPNVGHLDAAAGIAGLIKAALVVRDGRVPATLNFREPTPMFDFANSPFVVNAEARDWPSVAGPRRAAVSSFGIGGTNAHIILEQAPATGTSTTVAGGNGNEVILPLSARSAAALDRATIRLRDYLAANASVKLSDVAFSLQVGREAFTHRRAIVCDSIESAIVALSETGNAPVRGRGSAETMALATQWTAGSPSTWASNGVRHGRRIPLPSYAFEREHHWIDAPLRGGLYELRWKPIGPSATGSADNLTVREWPASDASGDQASQISAVLEQALSEARAFSGTTRLLWITRRAHAVLDTERPDPVAAAVSAFGRAAAKEHPAGMFTIVDVDDSPSARDAATRLALSDDATRETLLAIREGAPLVGRLEPVVAREGLGTRDIDGPVVITGGFGGVGSAIARHLVTRRHVRHIVLVGRRSLGVEESAQVAALERLGARVTVRMGDVADRGFVDRLVSDCAPAGVVHAAGVVNDSIVSNQTIEQLRAVLDAKVRGAWNCHEATAGKSLSMFVLCSSLSSILAPTGQAAYASANAALSALAEIRRASWLPATSVAWGPWAGVGMSARRAGEDIDRAERAGLFALATSDALGLLDECIDRDDLPPSVVAALNPPTETTANRRQQLEPAESDVAPWLAQLSGINPADRRRALTELLADETRRLIGANGSLPLDLPLPEIGMDSLMAIELRTRLTHRLGRPFAGSLLFDNPSIAGLAAALLDLVGADLANGPAIARRSTVSSPRTPRALHPAAPYAPMFLIGGAVGGDELYLRDLATALGPLQPSYALLYPGMDGEGDPVTDVGALADGFIAQIESIVADGDCVIAGHSMGGIVAFEVAQRLTARNRGVTELILLDAPLFLDGDTAAERERESWTRMTFAEYLALMRERGWLTPDVEAIVERHQGTREWDVIDRAWRANMAAMGDYRPGRAYHGEATFITPSNPTDGLLACAPAWRTVCPALKVVKTSGNHIAMVRAPHAQRTARSIRNLFTRGDLDEV